jgi:purine-binding chemotaxis protein CheW
MQADQPTVQSYLTFKLGEETFAAPVTQVSEILELSKITKVPRAPHYMRGVINLRGTVLPVIDARVKFGLDRTEDSIHTCIMVLNIAMENQSITLGALVDAVQEVLEIEPARIQPAPSIGSKYKSEFIDGMVKLNDDFIMLLNLNKVFSSDEMFVLQETTHEQVS